MHVFCSLAVMAAFDPARGAEEKRLILQPIHAAAPNAPQAKDLLAVRPKSLQQLIVECQEELTGARIALPSRPAGELAVNSAGILSFPAQDVNTPPRPDVGGRLDFGSPPSP